MIGRQRVLLTSRRREEHADVLDRKIDRARGSRVYVLVNNDCVEAH